MEVYGIVAEMAKKVKINKKKIVLPESEDSRVLKAAAIVAENDYADIVLIGQKKKKLKRSVKMKILICHMIRYKLLTI